MRKTQDVSTRREDGPIGGTIYSHPAFGQIVANRVSGRANLYGSDFQHQGYITIRLSHSEVRRDLSKDWYHSGNEIVEVSLSESQWATFVSAMNVGMGVPCTIGHIEGKSIPLLPDPPSRDSQFSGELGEHMKKAVEQLEQVCVRIAASGLSKKKADELCKQVGMAISNISCNLQFVSDQFGEHMEGVVEKAKQEIHGHISNASARAGINAINSGQHPIEILTVQDGEAVQP